MRAPAGLYSIELGWMKKVSPFAWRSARSLMSGTIIATMVRMLKRSPLLRLRAISSRSVLPMPMPVLPRLPPTPFSSVWGRSAQRRQCLVATEVGRQFQGGGVFPLAVADPGGSTVAVAVGAGSAVGTCVGGGAAVAVASAVGAGD